MVDALRPRIGMICIFYTLTVARYAASIAQMNLVSAVQSARIGKTFALTGLQHFADFLNLGVVIFRLQGHEILQPRFAAYGIDVNPLGLHRVQQVQSRIGIAAFRAPRLAMLVLG